MTAPLHPFSISRFFSLLFRHKKKIVFIPAVSIGLGLLIIFFFPRTYLSEAKLFLQVGRESVGLDPTATTGQMISFMQSTREDEIKSAIELLTGRSVISKTVESLTPDVVLGNAGPAAEVKPNPIAQAIKNVMGMTIGWIKDIDPVSKEEEALIAIERNLDVSAERGSTVIVCKYEAESPELAQQTLQALVDSYQKEHLRIHRNQDSLNFFVGQRDELKGVLDKATEKLRDKKNIVGIASVNGRRDSLERQYNDVELSKLKAEQELATANARVEDLQRQLAAVPERLVSQRRQVPNQGADMMRDQLYALRVKEKDLLSRYNESHPLVVAIKDQVAEAQKLVDGEKTEREETTNDINHIHQSLSLQLKQDLSLVAGLESRLEAIEGQRELVLADLKQLNVDEVEIHQLENEEQAARNNWLQYTENLEQARIDMQREESQVSNVSMAQTPTLMRKPVSPSKALVGLASLMMATAGTIASVLGSERLNNTLRNREQVEQALGIPVVGEIPKSSAAGRVLAHR